MDSILDFVVSGAGISGVVISKYLKENGITFLTLEKRDGIGGLWYYSDDENITTITKNTITTSGRRITHFSDFPPHKEWTHFLRGDELLQHIHEYAEHYEILGNIELSATILRVEKDEDSLWRIEYKNKHEERKTVYARNFVVAGGAFSNKLTPLADKYSSSFDGEIYSGQQIKLNNKIKFCGKRVLVTGGGETASDMAMHAACVADKACWAIPDGLQSLDRCRIGAAGSPQETVFDEGPSLMRNRLHSQHLSDKKCNNEYFIHKNLGANGHGVKEWIVDNYYGNKFPTKNGESIYLVHEGKIKPYRSVANISGNRVFFDNGKSEEIDMIIECTGYRKGYDYLADESLQTPDYNKLYRGFIRTDDPSLYFLGVVRPMIGSVPAFVEYQSQYIVDLFKQSIQLPSRDEMQARIDKDMEYHMNLFQGCGRFRPDILDGFTYYPYVMSADMGRSPEDHLDGLSEEEKDKVLNSSFNAGLFLWIGDPRKQADFIRSIEISRQTENFRRNLVRASTTGLKMVPLFRKLDEKVFKKKNAANLLFYGKGLLHRNYLLSKKFPLLMKVIGKFTGKFTGRNASGPFPLNHPYFTYKDIDFYGTTTFEKAVFFFLFAGIFLVLNFVANSGFNLSTYLCAPVFVAAMYLLKLKRRKSLLLLGGLQAVAYYFLNGNHLTLEMLFVPIAYGTLFHWIVNSRKTIPCMRQEVGAML